MNHGYELIGLDLRLVSDRAIILLQPRQCTSDQWDSPPSVALALRRGEDWIGRLAILIQLDPRASASIIRTVRNSAVANLKGVG